MPRIIRLNIESTQKNNLFGDTDLMAVETNESRALKQFANSFGPHANICLQPDSYVWNTKSGVATSSVAKSAIRHRMNMIGDIDKI